MRAKISAARGDIKSALKDYDGAIALNPGDTGALLARGHLQDAHGDKETAEQDFTRVLDIDPANVAAYAARGALHISSTDPQLVARAVADLSTARRLMPYDTEALLLLGNAQLRANANEAAAATFASVLAQSPDEPRALHGRATAEGRLGEYGAAIADLDRLLELRPDNDDALKARGVARLQAEDYMTAASDFSSLLATTPDDVEALFFRATARFRAGDVPGAIADFAGVLAARPGDADALAGRGLALLTNGQLADAERDFTTAVGTAPNAGTLYVHRGQLRLLRGNYNGAMEDLAVAMKTDAASPEVALWRHVAARRAGQDTTWLKTAQIGFRNGGWPKTRWPMPLLGYLVGDTTAAEIAAEAAESPVRECEAAFFLGQEALWNGKKDDASAHFAAALTAGARGSLAFIGAKVALTQLRGPTKINFCAVARRAKSRHIGP